MAEPWPLAHNPSANTAERQKLHTIPILQIDVGHLFYLRFDPAGQWRINLKTRNLWCAEQLLVFCARQTFL